MRLVCPNCDAQYEVDDAAIPASGRDVQCSNCGHAWFQLHPDELAALEQESEVFEPLPDSPPPPPPIPPEPEPDFELDFPPEPEGEEVPPPEPVAAAPKRAIDANVLAVLREEAERERAVRESEAPVGIEVQQDLGLPPPPPPPLPPSVVAARERFRDLSLDADDEEEDHPARSSSRRELLPDIEEINSTLRASTARQDDADDEIPMLPAAVVDNRQGFRSGFVLMMIIAVALWVGYAMAPRIAEQFPASASAIDTYVKAVDRARMGIDAALKSATEQLRDLSGDKG